MVKDRIKCFNGKIEERCNKWLSGRDDIEVIAIRYQTGEFGDALTVHFKLKKQK